MGFEETSSGKPGVLSSNAVDIRCNNQGLCYVIFAVVLLDPEAVPAYLSGDKWDCLSKRNILSL